MIGNEIKHIDRFSYRLAVICYNTILDALPMVDHRYLTRQIYSDSGAEPNVQPDVVKFFVPSVILKHQITGVGGRPVPRRGEDYTSGATRARPSFTLWLRYSISALLHKLNIAKKSL